MTNPSAAVKAANHPQENTQPVASPDRAEILDVLRGFALFGILLAHVPSFSGYDYLSPDRAQKLDVLGLDRWMVVFVDFFVDGKSVSLFSLLFGIGFAIQMRHLKDNDLTTRRRFMRRLFFLLLIGLAHTFLLWQGDILMYYALLGFFLLSVRNRSPQALLFLGVISLMMPAVTYAIIYGVFTWVPGVLPSGEGGTSEYTIQLESISSVFANGTYTQVLAANFSFWKIKIQWILFDGKLFTIFGMFLIGAALGKLRLHYKLAEYRIQIRNSLIVMATVGLIGNIFLLYSQAHHELYPPSPHGIFTAFVSGISRPSLGMAYAAALCLCNPLGKGRHLYTFFSPVGRMALTTYLSQTVICIGIFYGYGLGFRDTLSQTEALFAAVAIFTAQSLACQWWLSRYRYGPIEWIWRQFTYGQTMKLRR